MRLMCKGTSVHIRASKLPVDLLFHISHLLNLRAGGRPSSIILLTNGIHTQQIYGTTIKRGHIIVWKAVMIVQVAGLLVSGH